MDIGYISLKGKVREKDEDSILVLYSAFESEGIEERIAMAAVADGMGGGELGEVASRIAVTAIRNHFLPILMNERLEEQGVRDSLIETFKKANLEILSYSKNHKVSWMGTTATSVLLYGNIALIGNVGDSRTYIFDSKGRVKFKTKDNSYIQELIDSGQITEEEARRDQRQNQLTQALGIEETTKIDIYKRELEKGDSILLCCDGLWEVFDDDELGRSASKKNSAQQAANLLAETANERDGSDNISLVLIKL